MIFETFWRKKQKQQDKTTEESTEIDVDTFKYKTTIETRFADFDMMGHVNNAAYFTFMEIARSKYWKQAIQWDWKKTGVIIARASLDYIVPILPDDKISIYVRTSKIGNTSFELEYLFVKQKNNDEVICSKGKTVCVAFSYVQNAPVQIPHNERNKMLIFEQLNEH
ncbi:acyl-CoA thioesterase [Pedobacter faecalis]|uniref:acyl-CoA thioesterase n=1 Tax=Pedobacter faecalis TaxID=3041495 RepID=UPI00254A9D37|nr:thioesterase family protein [Pedobacter sp. ELA7]